MARPSLTAVPDGLPLVTPRLDTEPQVDIIVSHSARSARTESKPKGPFGLSTATLSLSRYRVGVSTRVRVGHCRSSAPMTRHPSWARTTASVPGCCMSAASGQVRKQRFRVCARAPSS